ncbi:FLYWCH zinc finger domain-containing protein [Ditylenchus destructor]|nr:FLYWCH zinc finger domain-containing protein [Ditylenchus destructor]
MQNQRVIQSVRDQPLIEAQNGFLFRFDKSSADKTKWYWRCNYRGCRARAVSGVNSVDLIVTQPVHLDFASPNNINRRERVRDAKDIAFRMPLAPAGQVLAAAKTQMSEDQLRSFPSNEAMRKAVSRVRMPLAAGILDCPLSQVDWALAERYTKNRADEQFLFYDSRTQYPNEKRSKMTSPYFKIFGLLLIPLVFVSAQDNRQPANTTQRLPVVADCAVNNDCQPLFILYFLDGYCEIIRNNLGNVLRHECRYEINWAMFLLLFLLPLLLLLIGLLSYAMYRRKQRAKGGQRSNYRGTNTNPNYAERQTTTTHTIHNSHNPPI